MLLPPAHPLGCSYCKTELQLTDSHWAVFVSGGVKPARSQACCPEPRGAWDRQGGLNRGSASPAISTAQLPWHTPVPCWALEVSCDISRSFHGDSRVHCCVCVPVLMGSLTPAHQGCQGLCDPRAEGLGSWVLAVPVPLSLPGWRGVFCHPAPTGWSQSIPPQELPWWSLSLGALGAVPELCRGLLRADPISGTVPCLHPGPAWLLSCCPAVGWLGGHWAEPSCHPWLPGSPWPWSCATTRDLSAHSWNH